MSPVITQLMLLVLCLVMGWNLDAGRQISRDFGRETMHMMHESWAIDRSLRCLQSKSHAEMFRKHMPHDADIDLKSLIHQHAACDP